MDPRRYFDHAATGFPKPPQVLRAIEQWFAAAGSPGRGAHDWAAAAARTLTETRLEAARVFGHADPARVAFAASATDALNMAVAGLDWPAGSHVVTSSVEHNALMRPLARLVDEGRIRLTVVESSPDGHVEVAALAAAIESQTRLVAVTAGSNVLGSRVDLAALRPAIGPQPLLLVDAAQTAGVLPVSMDAWGLDLLAVPGHKGLGGPPGIGLLLASGRVELAVWREGGTGGRSEPRRTPAEWPEGYEAGTPNGPGIAGLGAVLAALDPDRLEATFAARMAVWQVLVEGLQSIPGMEIFSCLDPNRALPLVSFRVAGLDPADLAWRLGRNEGYAVRAGLHCAPAAHRTAGTEATGLVRASLGPDHTAEDAAAFVRAVAHVVRAAAA